MQKFFTKKYYADKKQSTSVKNKAILALLIVSFFWGTTWLVSKEGERNMPAMQLVALRQFIAGSLLLSYFIFKRAAWPGKKQWRTIFILSFLNFMISNMLSTWGVKYIPSGLASIMGAIFPLWLVIITMLKGKRLPPQALLGLLLGFGGVCLIFYEHLKEFLNPDFRTGIYLSLAATISWAFGTIYTKQQAMHFNPYFSLGFQMFFAGIIIFIVALASGNTIPFSQIPRISWMAICYLVVFGSLITFAAYIYTLQHLPTALASVYAYINPIVALILGALLVNEKLTAFIGVGGIITIAGVYLVNNSLKKKNILEPEAIN